MKTNQEIGNILKSERKITEFAEFLHISQQGLYKRLNSSSVKDNLYGVWSYWLEVRGTKKRKS